MKQINDEDFGNLIEGRDIILYYLIQSLEEFYAINPQLIRNGFAKILQRHLPKFSKRFLGEKISPQDFKGPEDFNNAVQLFIKTFLGRNIYDDTSVEYPDPSKIVATITNCTYKDLAKICVEKGHTGCIFCPIAFASNSIAAFIDLGWETKKIDCEFDMDTENCTVTSHTVPT